MARKRYSYKERKAYHMGQGAAQVGAKPSGIKKTVQHMSEAEKKSFYNGFDDQASKRR